MSEEVIYYCKQGDPYCIYPKCRCNTKPVQEEPIARSSSKNSIENEFIPYDEALELKRLGFEEPCFKLIETNGIQRVAVNNDYSKGKKDIIGDEQICFRNRSGSGSELFATIPLYQQAFKWFRENHNLISYISYDKVLHYYYIYIDSVMFVPTIDGKRCPEFNSYDEAELACLKRLIEMVKANKM